MGRIMLKRKLVVKLIQIQNDNLHLYIQYRRKILHFRNTAYSFIQ